MCSLGSTNNPTTIQFKSSFRKLLVGATHISIFGNCMLQDDTTISVIPAHVDKIDVSVEDEAVAPIYIEGLETKSEYRSNILSYIKVLYKEV